MQAFRACRDLFGLQYSRTVGPATVQGRADVVFYGAFKYNDANTIGQDAYSLVNLRLGINWRLLVGEVFVRNAFDTRYIPLAFPYASFARRGSWARWALHAPPA